MEKVVNKLKSFYKDKTVLVTGHTGFKGSWLSLFLNSLGAKVIGYSLEPNTTPNLYSLANIENVVESYISDIRSFDSLKTVMDKHKPDVVFHLAAQPLVIDSYKDPRYTYETNVMGTINILDVIRTSNYVKSFVNVTTDKVYKNNEWLWGYREDEELDGFDPYSNSKSCSELVTKTYKRSFFDDKEDVSISTVRAGNVIGGGDFSNNRIIPDCMKALLESKPIEIRNPNSVRPYQHVLEPLYAYILIGYLQYNDKFYSDSYNVGPYEDDCVTTGNLVKLFVDNSYKKIDIKQVGKEGPHEANFLKLDVSKIKNKIKWTPKWSVEDAIQKTIQWIKVFESNKEDIRKIMYNQIDEYLEMEV